MQAPSVPLVSASLAHRAGEPEATSSSGVSSWLRPVDVAAAGLLFVMHLVLCNPEYTFLTGVGAGLLGATLVIVVARYRRVSGVRLPWIEYTFARFYVQFAIATTADAPLVGLWEVRPSAEAHEKAMFIAVLSGCALLGGFALAHPLFRRITTMKIFPPLTARDLSAGARLYFWPSALFVVAYTLAPSIKTSLSTAFSLFVGLFDRNVLAGICALAYLVAPSRGSLARLVALGAVVVGTSMVTSMLGDIMFPLGTVIVLWWMKRRRFPLAAVAIGALLMLMIQPVKGYYRTLKWGDAANSGTTIGVVDAWTEAFTRSREEDSSGSEEARHRLGELSVLAYTVDLVPRAIPHLDGESYKYIPMTLVPRIIWPDKPNLTKVGTDWLVIRLGLHSEESADNTSVGLSLLSHGYFEHGMWGPLLFVFFEGLVFGFMSLLFTGNLARTLAGSFLLVSLVHASESGLIGFIASLWQCVFLALVIVWVLYALGRMFPDRGTATAR